MIIIDNILKNLLNVSGFILSIAVTILMVTEIVGRHLFAHGFRGLPEIYLLLVMWLYMLGASLASANRSHLRIGIMDQLITSTRAKQVYHLFLNAISLIIMLFFVRWGWGLVDWGIKRPRILPGAGPTTHAHLLPTNRHCTLQMEDVIRAVAIMAE